MIFNFQEGLKIKILLIYSGRKGGGSVYSFEMAKALNEKKDINLKVIISEYQEDIEKWENIGIDIYRIKTYRGYFSFILSTLNIKKFLDFKKEINSFKPDIIYYPMINLWTPIFNLFFSAPIITTIHDPIPRYREKNPIHYIQPLVIKQSNHIVLLSAKYKNNLVKLINVDKITVIPHGIFSFYKNNYQHKNDNNKINLLFFGKIKPYKGLDILLNSYSIIKKKISNVELTVAGEGSLKEYKNMLDKLEDIKIDNRWLGKNDVDKYFKKADIVVLPYKDASQSGIIPIAFSYGLAVVASDVGGLKEQVIDGKTALLFQKDNSEQLAELIIELAQKDKMRKILGENAKKFAYKNWQWKDSAEQVREIALKELARQER